MDIVLTLTMRASPAQVFHALTDPRVGWWGEDARELRLGDEAPAARGRILAVENATKLAWRCVEGPPGWVDTEISVDLAKEGDDTIVRFRHANWREATDAMGRSSARWASLLFDLRSALQVPEPDDLYVG